MEMDSLISVFIHLFSNGALAIPSIIFYQYHTLLSSQSIDAFNNLRSK